MEVKPYRNVRKQILIDEETNTKLKFAAVTHYVSENEIINRALTCYLKRSKFPTLKEMREGLANVK